ncbi:hypothetical protein, partial [Providencia stuartii]|uniref:hypothetical protein n=1 Tax=Providencia stuartii TaxID=588 RepID=UPI001EF8AB6B
ADGSSIALAMGSVIREAERENVNNEFIEMDNEIMTGEVARAGKNVVYVNLGRIEGIMTQLE